MTLKKIGIFLSALVILSLITIAIFVVWDGEGGRGKENTPPRVDPYPYDRDRDGLSDTEEALQKTSDAEFDTDFDGLFDRAEVDIWHTDPTKADTDGDGYGDGIEVIRGYDPGGAGKLP